MKIDNVMVDLYGNLINVESVWRLILLKYKVDYSQQLYFLRPVSRDSGTDQNSEYN